MNVDVMENVFLDGIWDVYIAILGEMMPRWPSTMFAQESEYDGNFVKPWLDSMSSRIIDHDEPWQNHPRRTP